VIDTPINPDFGEGRWQDALRRMRDRIEGGLKLKAWDCDVIGSKDTHCSWGMCSNDVEQWPDKDDHTFPDDFEERKRVSPRDAPGGCPLDERTLTPDEDPMSCFYTCLVFTRKRISKRDRDQALRRYNETIVTREMEHGKLSAEDDDEPWREVDDEA
jgi:hypothetical protein